MRIFKLSTKEIFMSLLISSGLTFAVFAPNSLNKKMYDRSLHSDKHNYAKMYVEYSKKLGLEYIGQDSVLKILNNNISKYSPMLKIGGTYNIIPTSVDHKTIRINPLLLLFKSGKQTRMHEIGHGHPSLADSVLVATPFDHSLYNKDSVTNMSYGTEGIWNTGFVRGRGEYCFGIRFNEGVNEFITYSMMGKKLPSKSGVYHEETKTVALMSAIFGEDTIVLSYLNPRILERKYDNILGKDSFSRLLL